MASAEFREYLAKNPEALYEELTRHTLWVCFLSPEGLEEFRNVTFDGATFTPKEERDSIPQPIEISTIQFFDPNGEPVIVLPTGQLDDGTYSFETADALVQKDALPTFTTLSLAKRIRKQPFRTQPNSPIHSLSQLQSFKEAILFTK